MAFIGTPSSRVYHADDCPVASPKAAPLSEEEIEQRTACAVCNPDISIDLEDDPAAEDDGPLVDWHRTSTGSVNWGHAGTRLA